MYEFINIAKALSDENRVRALMMLSQGELCVCQLIEMLNLAPSTVSKHMSILRQARLVTARKQATWNYYRLADGDAPEHVLEAIRWMRNSLIRDKQTTTDAKRLKVVCKKSMDELCKCYRSPRPRDKRYRRPRDSRTTAPKRR